LNFGKGRFRWDSTGLRVDLSAVLIFAHQIGSLAESDVKNAGPILGFHLEPLNPGPDRTETEVREGHNFSFKTTLTNQCAKISLMRIETSGAYSWRTDLYDDVADRVGASTRSKAIDTSYKFTKEMVGNLERAVNHPDMTDELAEILSTGAVEVEYRIETGVNVRDQ